MANDNQTIIIKRIKRGDGGHHGGAWKVAFADFVTAMMAFFMLMWLLGSTTPEQKAAIAEYFNNPTSIVPGESGGGSSMIHNGGDKEAPTGQDLDVNPPSTPGELQVESDDAVDEDEGEVAHKREVERMESIMGDLQKSIQSGQALAQFKDQLIFDVTGEGLRIQIIDEENRPMFDSGSANLKGYTETILREVGKAISDAPNRISISGHTDKTPFSSGNGYSNWELSADRANAARRALLAAGVADAKIGRVVGLSDSVLFDKKDPYNPINRRISIVVMNKETDKSLSEREGAAEKSGGDRHDAKKSNVAMAIGE
ncbi:MAG: motility protein MotB [Nitrospirae bacterium CG18_big_fil_WC_8_21_14_2_50_70_55]|nr:flagellar motor protein MotB [Deltaproteobacteria bacterium]OIP63289.1 MAG: hypothetical protein AUK30_08750 [Nitrospirae bacterium CG2_30_70_394]PIQ06655.1 MAG: motility protein MotB [Nitrospirae bacterium CG18_big_fil_WC_8_21_14_2_50_70_55]PIU78437.1 MAG: motility protein MotB [Nitrospirae bacterium CG06_land_8_20_14_3_00_70_43]PIW84050.1 MAG: motility protein MotB [Nitrospirae bacterium CG_4_8_14_3_um_filter_70_85]PIX84181.1 MAG: motility protein MotB [Nitrospirae bacterium CG_4_10_14_3_